MSWNAADRFVETQMWIYSKAHLRYTASYKNCKTKRNQQRYQEEKCGNGRFDLYSA